MSTTVYLIRHGESEANLHDVFLGHYNMDLTQIGRKQASMTADYLKSQVSQTDVIYSSDLVRAYHTAKYTAELFDMPIIKDKNLREIDAGYWDTVKFDDLANKFADSYDTWCNNIGFARCDGGESVEELQKRIVSAVTRIARRHKDGVVFLFTHATPIRVFAAHCLMKSLEEVKDVPWVANASITKVIFDNEAFELEEYGYDSFMGHLSTRLPSNV